MKGSLHDLISLADIDPAHSNYGSQIDKVFDVLHHCISQTPVLERLRLTASVHFFLAKLHNDCDVSARLSAGFIRIWPSVWKIVRSFCFPLLQQHKVVVGTRRIVRGEVIAILSILGDDHPTMLWMISTPGFSSLVVEIWSMEVDHPDYEPWDDEQYTSMALVLDRVLGALTPSNCTSEIGLEQFLGSRVQDLKSLASTALKHLHHAFY
jgi:hypothetical protein